MNITWYGISSLVFGIVLFFPVRKLMLSMSINKHQRKVQRQITAEETEALKKKVSPLAAAISITFAFLYNKFILLKFMGPSK